MGHQVELQQENVQFSWAWAVQNESRYLFLTIQFYEPTSIS